MCDTPDIQAPPPPAAPPPQLEQQAPMSAGQRANGLGKNREGLSRYKIGFRDTGGDYRRSGTGMGSAVRRILTPIGGSTSGGTTTSTPSTGGGISRELRIGK